MNSLGRAEEWVGSEDIFEMLEPMRLSIVYVDFPRPFPVATPRAPGGGAEHRREGRRNAALELRPAREDDRGRRGFL